MRQGREQLVSAWDVSGLLLFVKGERGSTYPLVDEHGKDEDGDKEDNDEDDDDTGFALSPVLALHELVDGVLAARDEGHVDGGHCECGGFLEER
jgi:hypothetical protein